MADIDDFLDGYEAAVEEVPICGKPGLVAEFSRLESEIAGHMRDGGLGGAPQELYDQLREVEEAIEASVMVVKLRALGFRAWADLQGQYPPTDEERARGLRFSDMLDPAAVAATAVEPRITVEQADRMRATLPPSEWGLLVTTVRRLHEEVTSAPKSPLLSVGRLMSASASATPPTEGSLGESSAGGSGEQ